MNDLVRSTTDYEKFELHPINRDVSKIRFLTKAMREHGWIPAYPCHVRVNGNKKFKVIDGHHRLEVAQSLGIPAKYVVCNDDISIPDLAKTVNKWSLHDFLNGYVRDGRPDYIVIKDFIEETRIPLATAIGFFRGSPSGSGGNYSDMFINGTYKVTSTKLTDRIKDVVLYMQSLGLKYASSKPFVTALSRAMCVPEFRASDFKKKIKQYPSLITHQSTSDGYLTEIEIVCNRGARKKEPIAFRAKEELKKRLLFQKK